MLLRKGSTGDEVEALKLSLKAQGYDIDINSVFDAKTDDAVRAFQADQGLQIDGVVGNQTFTRIQKLEAAPELDTIAQLQRGDRGDDVFSLQLSLQALGHELSIDGIFGREVQGIVRNFQKNQGLDATGIADAATLARIQALEEARSVGAQIRNARGDSSQASPTAAPEIMAPTPPAESTPSPETETLTPLKRGDKGDDVWDMQESFKQFGYKIGIDGIFGGGTQSVVRQYQRDQDLKVTGVADVATLTRIQEMHASPNGGLTFIPPVAEGIITSKFGDRTPPARGASSTHAALDIAPLNRGEKIPVNAMAGGTIEHIGRRGGWGKTIEILHPNGHTTRYSHLHAYGDFQRGDTVQAGQQIGVMGSTGVSTNTHLDVAAYNADGREYQPVFIGYLNMDLLANNRRENDTMHARIKFESGDPMYYVSETHATQVIAQAEQETEMAAAAQRLETQGVIASLSANTRPSAPSQSLVVASVNSSREPNGI